MVAALAAVALTAGVAATYADRAVFDADGFAQRVNTALRSGPVSEELGERLTDEVISAEPDLVAVRPLIAGAAQTIVRGAAFRSLARGAARDLHRSVFQRDSATVTLTVADTSVLVTEALGRLRPDLARRVPDDLTVRVFGGGQRRRDRRGPCRGVRRARSRDRDRRARPLRAAGGPDRVALAAPGRGAAGRGGGAGRGHGRRARVLAPRAFDDPAGRAVAETWLHPLAVWCGAVAGAGVIAALAAAAILRPVTLLPRLWATAPAASPSAASPPAASAATSAALPSAALPSAALPSAALPSAALPSAASPSAASAPALSPASPPAASPPAASPPAASPPAASPPAASPPAASPSRPHRPRHPRPLRPSRTAPRRGFSAHPRGPGHSSPSPSARRC